MTSMHRIIKIAVTTVVVSLVAVVVAPAAWAMTEAPGWEISSHTFPTNLGHPVSEVQTVDVSATEGTFTLGVGGVETGPLNYNAGPAAVQSALEGLPGLGSGNVAVGGAAQHYEVSFVGAQAGRPVYELETGSGSLSENGEPGTVTDRVVTPGAVSGMVVDDLFNIGAGGTSGPITVTDVLPAGVRAVDAGLLVNVKEPTLNGGEIEHRIWECKGNHAGGAVTGASMVTCTTNTSELPTVHGGGGSPNSTSPPNLVPQLGITVDSDLAPSSLVNRAVVAGGGAPAPTSVEAPITVSTQPPAFGFATWHVWFPNADGTLDTQAGSHPYEAIFAYQLATTLNSKGELEAAGGDIRNIEVALPPGVAGNPTAVPECDRQQLDNEKCPSDTKLGSLITYTAGGIDIGDAVFNMQPPHGVVSELGFNFDEKARVRFDSSVRSGGDYGITTHIDNVPQREITENYFTLWDVPQERGHDWWRNGTLNGCDEEQWKTVEPLREAGCVASEFPAAQPFFTMPTHCGEAGAVRIKANTWQEESVTAEASAELPAMTGCEGLGFDPTITTKTDTARSDTPAGLTVEVNPPVGGLEDPSELGSSDIQDTTVTLPPGFVINPGQAAGLQACGPRKTV